MKVVLSGVYYPMAIVRYFERALRRRDDIELCTVGRYTGKTIPWNGGMILNVSAPPPDLVLTSSRTPISYVEAHLLWKPDVWIQLNSTEGLIGKPSKGKNFVVGVDPHCINYDEARQWADVFFCMQTPYMRPDDIWLPYAYDPSCHTPNTDCTRERPYDGGLIGAPYINRVRLVESLRAQGHKILFPGFGPVFGEYRDLLHTCKIGLNWSTQQDLCARVFEVAAMGLCPVVNRVPDLMKMGFVEGKHYLGFDSLDEALSQFKVALGKWQEISQQACEFVAPHTWDARVETVLSYV
jgi:hypothetical protein